MFFKIFLQYVMQIESKNFSNSFSVKALTLSFLVVHFVAITCCFFSFPVKAVFFLCRVSVSHARFYCTVSTYFQISFKNQPLVAKQTNHIISTCVNRGLPVNIGRGVNIGCDRCFYISFNDTFY